MNNLLNKDHETMDAIVEFARRKNLSCIEEITSRRLFLTSKIGWLFNRLEIAGKSQIARILGVLKLLRYRLNWF